MYFFSLSSFGLKKAYSSFGTQPTPGVIELLCNLFGGPLSLIGTVALAILGFLHFQWWVPIVVFFGSSFIAGYTYGKLPIGATYAIFGFPVGLMFGVAWFLLR